MSNNTTIIKNSLFLLLNLLVKIFITLYCSRVVLQELGVIDYGIYNVVAGIVTLLSFLTGSMTSATQRFLSVEIGSGSGKSDKIFSMSINVYIVIALIVVVISQFIGIWFIENGLNIPDERVSAARWVYQCSVVSFVFIILSAPFNAVLIAFEKMKVYSYIGIIVLFFRLGLVLSLLFIDGDKLVIYSLLVIVVSFLGFIVPAYYVKKEIRGISYRWTPDLSLFKEMLSFTGWSLYGNLAGAGFNQGISILLNVFFGPSINAARAVSSQINGALLGVVSNVNVAANPQIIQNYSKGNQKRTIELVFSASKYSFICLWFISLPILFNIDYILSLWLGNVPKHSAEFVKLIIIDGLVCGFSGSLITSVQATGKIKFYQLTIGSILLLNIPFSYILLKNNENVFIPFFVMIMLSFVAFNFRLLFVKKYLHISILEYYKIVVFPSVLSLVITIFSIKLLRNNYYTIEHSFLISSVVTIILSLIFIWTFGLSKNERGTIRKAAKSTMSK
ncbi:hypothetical protein A9264_15345 [Vibrio sp. UCD-FRSSP16_10]|uniref:hypothetical protein n=1 Tax=unclassified Vibrio TaxID=2614977 RepID=UPI0007FFF093|nr:MULTISPECIES: hypothetical protein [unclassified Vibrio]OBT13678.1 hypothetical protein A9260_14010 [Vibrio sp. UCD-FRSSP16_30]OBT19232.1 hypothetical protein A9264_15345 [Vibrio sp. UCD-FRSSP16_10]